MEKTSIKSNCVSYVGVSYFVFAINCVRVRFQLAKAVQDKS